MSTTGVSVGNTVQVAATTGGQLATSNSTTGGAAATTTTALTAQSSATGAGATAGFGGASSTESSALSSSSSGGNTSGGENSTTGTALAECSDESPVACHGQLQVVGSQLSNEAGQPVILRGQGFGWDNWWPQYYNAGVVGWLRDDWCVDIVRPAMGIEPEGAYLQDQAASKARMRAVVEAAISEGLYVIIDWHAHDLHQNEAIAFFSEMAQAYGQHPNVLYEIFNEPEDDETWPQVKSYAEAVIAAIRQYDPDNIVIVGSPEWDQRVDLVAEDPITSDDHVVYSLHFYAAAHGDWLRERMSSAIRAGIPIFVSESSGSEASGLGANDYAEWQAWFDAMESHRVSWVHYSISDKQGETISVLEPGAPSEGGWNDSQLTETGEYIREVLRRHCP